MVAWNRERVEFYAGQVLSSLLQNPKATDELITGDQEPHVWAEHWSDIAFDIAEVFAGEADQRDDDPACRLLEEDS